VLDPALLRPGRFDRRVVVSRPDVRGREEILRVHTRKIPLAEDVDLSVLARGTPGFSGADLANMVNEAALAAARLNRKAVLQYDFELAKDKVLMGVERKSLLLTDEEKKNTAYHEAGHALVAAKMPNSDPLHKVTIIPRGMALGVTMQLPIDDRHNYYKNYLETEIAIAQDNIVKQKKALAIADVRDACEVLRAIFEGDGKGASLRGGDGFVSLEVSPAIARDTQRTVEEAKRFWAAVDRPNLFIQLPATLEGLPSIRQALSAVNSVNVTSALLTERMRKLKLDGLAKAAQMLEAGDQIVRVSHDDHAASSLLPPPVIGPEIEGVVQVDIGKQW